MSILDRFLGSDDDSGDAGNGDGDDELLFDEGDDFDELGGDDEFGDDLSFGGDEDAAGGSTRELESRVDELENELSSLSSTVGTVKSENEEISNTVDDIEENVRKLLDIYEMVTRGVNPFVDDVQTGGDFDDGGSLGLFDTDEEEEEEELDEDLAGADAEDFFDDDFLDDDDESFESADDSFDGASGSIDGAGDSLDETGSDMADDTDDSGKSFEELKNEYDSGDADWATDEGGDGGTNADDAEGFADVDEGFDAGDEGLGDAGDDFGDSMGEFDDGDDLEATVTTEDPIANGEAAEPNAGAAEPADAADPSAADATADPSAEPTARAAPDRSAAAAQSAGDLQFAENTLMSGAGPRAKPYLDALPAGFVVDLLVLEWIEYLVEESDPTDAARAIEYYRTIEWVSDDVADSLRNFLQGFGDVDADPEGVRPSPTSLTLDHHVNSLQYVSRLTSGTSDALLFERCLGGSDGL
ncbi:MAG: FlaD/FlaE family flagellar protein [Haloferacaceae archaeon]